MFGLKYQKLRSITFKIHFWSYLNKKRICDLVGHELDIKKKHANPTTYNP